MTEQSTPPAQAATARASLSETEAQRQMTADAIRVTPGTASSVIEQVSERATLVRAENPSVMTLEGTNTWVLREPGATGVVVLDPGPLDEGHLATILDAAGRDGGKVALVLYSHWHPDHTASIDRFAELTGAPARALDAEWCRDATPLADGEVIELDGLTLRVIATPGHTRDSISVLIPAEDTLLTGDTILGRGTTVITYPDGQLGPYFATLRLLRGLIEQGVVRRMLPAHGPVIEEPLTVIDSYAAHREARLRDVAAALDAGLSTSAEITERVYGTIDRKRLPAAELTVKAQLAYLEEQRGAGA